MNDGWIRSCSARLRDVYENEEWSDDLLWVASGRFPLFARANHGDDLGIKSDTSKGSFFDFAYS